jgi:signal transduction histidine kinase
MRERLRLVHGTIRIHAAPAHGTTVDVWVPSKGRTS